MYLSKNNDFIIEDGAAACLAGADVLEQSQAGQLGERGFADGICWDDVPTTPVATGDSHLGNHRLCC